MVWLVLTEIRLIYIFDPVCNDCVWNNEEVEFDDKLSLLGRIVFGVPVVPRSSLAFSMHLEAGRDG